MGEAEAIESCQAMKMENKYIRAWYHHAEEARDTAFIFPRFRRSIVPFHNLIRLECDCSLLNFVPQSDESGLARISSVRQVSMRQPQLLSTQIPWLSLTRFHPLEALVHLKIQAKAERDEFFRSLDIS